MAAGTRSSSLTKKKIKDICELIADGNYAKVAAAANRVPESTFYFWLKEGERVAAEKEAWDDATPAERKAKGLKKATATELLYLELLESVREAQAQGQTFAVKTIKNAIQQGDVKAAFEYLSRTAPDDWTGKQKVELESKQTHGLDPDTLKALDVKDLAALAQRLRSKGE